MNQTISVIVPVYNAQPWLDRCVESLLAQSHSQLQILLVNDGSTDQSGSMCDQWAEKEPRIQAVHKPNGGLSSARNAGLDHATGQYVMFIDSDDVIHPDMCQILLQGLLQQDAQIATCEAAHTFEDQDPPYTVVTDWKVMDRQEAIRHMWYQTGFFPSACTKLYVRSLFDGERFTEGLLYEDVDIMHRLLWQTKKVACNDSALYGYMHRGESLTTQSFSLKALDILTIAQKMRDFAENTDPTLSGAANAYSATAAMRVALNAPKTKEFADGHAAAKTLLKKYSKSVIFDKRTRRKTRLGLLLYFLCRPLARMCYKRVNRWK